MNSTDHPSAYGHQPHYSHASKLPRPPVRENSLKTADLQVERKSYRFSLKENDRGRMLRITEDTGGRYDSIIIPAAGLSQFKQLLDEMIRANHELPEKENNQAGIDATPSTVPRN